MTRSGARRRAPATPRPGAAAPGAAAPGAPAAAVTVQETAAGEGSTLPPESTARTAKLWAPGASPPSAIGVAHGANAPPSRRHSKRTAASSDVNRKRAVAALVTAGTPAAMRVSGARRSGPSGNAACTYEVVLSSPPSTTSPVELVRGCFVDVGLLTIGAEGSWRSGVPAPGAKAGLSRLVLL